MDVIYPYIKVAKIELIFLFLDGALSCNVFIRWSYIERGCIKLQSHSLTLALDTLTRYLDEVVRHAGQGSKRF